MPRHQTTFEATDRARSQRKEVSTPERVMWSHLRSRQLGGLKFRRQYPIGPYVCDFYCCEAKLIVEVDGLVHESRADRDAARDVWMNEQGLRTLRVSPSWIAKDVDAVLAMIVAEAKNTQS